MAFTSGFFNSLNGDRKYDATQFGAIFDGVIQDGIFASIGNHFSVKPNGGMDLLIGTGRAWFNHTWSLNDSEMVLTVKAADTLYERIDAVVLEVNTSYSGRNNSIKIIYGTPASNPQNPPLTNANGVYQYPLAYIRLSVGLKEISNLNITNMVGTTQTPYVTGPLKSISNDALIEQWTDMYRKYYDTIQSTNNVKLDTYYEQFNSWFERVKDNLNGIGVANVLSELEDVERDLRTLREDGELIGDLQDNNGIKIQTSTGLGIDGVRKFSSETYISKDSARTETDTYKMFPFKSRRNMFRGKSLGTEITNDQWTAIKNGSFDDIYLGDYWTIDNNVYVVVDFDYIHNKAVNYSFGSHTYAGNTVHSLVIMPKYIYRVGNAAYTKRFNTDNNNNNNIVLPNGRASGFTVNNHNTAISDLVRIFGDDHIPTLTVPSTNYTSNTTDSSIATAIASDTYVRAVLTPHINQLIEWPTISMIENYTLFNRQFAAFDSVPAYDLLDISTSIITQDIADKGSLSALTYTKYGTINKVTLNTNVDCIPFIILV